MAVALRLTIFFHLLLFRSSGTEAAQSS